MLYKYELEEILNDLKLSLVEDNDDYIFTVTVNTGHVAMVLIEKSGQIHTTKRREKNSRLFGKPTMRII